MEWKQEQKEKIEGKIVVTNRQRKDIMNGCRWRIYQRRRSRNSCKKKAKRRNI